MNSNNIILQTKDKGIAIFHTNDTEKNDYTDDNMGSNIIKKESIKNYITTVSTDKLNINLNINFNTTNYSSLSKSKAISDKLLLNKNHISDTNKEIGIIKNCISNITNLFDSNIKTKKHSIVKKCSTKNSFNLDNINNKINDASKEKIMKSNNNFLKKQLEINNNDNLNTIDSEHLILDTKRNKKEKIESITNSKNNKTKIEVTKLPLTLNSLNTKYSDLTSEPNSYHQQQNSNFNEKIYSYQNSTGKIIFNNQLSLNNFNSIKSNTIKIVNKSSKENLVDKNNENVSEKSRSTSKNNKKKLNINKKLNIEIEKNSTKHGFDCKNLNSITNVNVANFNLKVPNSNLYSSSKLDEKVFLKTKSEIIDKKMPNLYSTNTRDSKMIKNVEANLINSKLNKSINNLGINKKIFKIKGFEKKKSFNIDNNQVNSNKNNNKQIEKNISKNIIKTTINEPEIETRHPGLKITEILNSHSKKNEDSYINIEGYCLTDTNFVNNKETRKNTNKKNSNLVEEELYEEMDKNSSNIENEYYLKTITIDNNYDTIVNSKKTIDATTKIKNQNSSVFDNSNSKKVFNAKFNTINNKAGSNNIKLSGNIISYGNYNFKSLKSSNNDFENKAKIDKNKATINSTVSKKSKNSQKEIAIANIIKNTVDSYYMLKNTNSDKTKIKAKDNKSDKLDKLNKQLNLVDIKTPKLLNKK